MTRKHYVMIANAIKVAAQDASAVSGLNGVKLVAGNIAFQLKQDNARFDGARFLKACGIDDNA